MKDGLGFRSWEKRRSGPGIRGEMDRGLEAGMAKVCPGEHPRCALVVRLVWLEQRMLMGEESDTRLQRCLRRRCGSCDDMQRTSPLQQGASDDL